MLILQAEEFNRQSRNSSNFSGKIYHQKILTPGVIFSIRQKNAALNYCRDWMNQNPSFLCLLVEDTHQIQVWYEQLNQQLDRVRPPNRIEKDSSSLLKSKYLPIDKSFVTQCQQNLIDSIGPIARIIVTKVISQNAKCNREQFIASLIEKLPKEQQKNAQQQLEQLLN